MKSCPICQGNIDKKYIGATRALEGDFGTRVAYGAQK